MYLIYRIFLPLSFICFSALAAGLYAQNSKISGTVTDKNTGESLPGVHVYISQTTIGAATNAEGEFEFSVPFKGNNLVVASFVGYKPAVSEVQFSAGRTYKLDFELEPDVIELNDIEVTADNRHWQRNFRRFHNLFIGQTNFARETHIENAWIIDFYRDDNRRLRAEASRPLMIANYALGYRLHIDLNEFMAGPGVESGFYTFFSRFEEIETGDNDLLDEWQENRQEAYLGSFRHFLRSLYSGTLSQNSFETVAMDTNSRLTIEELDGFAKNRAIGQYAPGINYPVKVYRLNMPTDILYGKSSRFRDNRIRSRIVPMRDSGIFMVTEQGALLDPTSLRQDGAWASERVANLLPDNYQLPD